MYTGSKYNGMWERAARAVAGRGAPRRARWAVHRSSGSRYPSGLLSCPAARRILHIFIILFPHKGNRLLALLSYSFVMLVTSADDDGQVNPLAFTLCYPVEHGRDLLQDAAPGAPGDCHSDRHPGRSSYIPLAGH
jgi:hypothetical protein